MLKRLLQSDLVKNSGWLLADKGIKLFIGLLVSVIVARYLGPDAMGEWNFALSFTTFFSVFAFLGFESILPRELVNDSDNKDSIISTAWISRGLSSLLAAGLAVLIMGLWKGWQSNYVLYVLVISSGFIFQTADVLDYYFQSILRSKYVAMSRLAAYILIAGVKLYLVYIEAPLLWFIVATVLELLISALGLVYFFRKKSGFSLSFRFDKDLIRDYAKDIIPLALSSLLIVIYMRIDQIMITEMRSEAENGIYSMGVKIVELVYFLPMILSSSYLPAITYVRKHEASKYRDKLLQFYSLMTYAAIGLTLLISLNSFWVMDLLYGVDYQGSGMILFIYSFSIYSTFMGVASSQYLSIERLLNISLYRTLIGVILNVILNLILIPKYGINGAAIASLVSYFFATFAGLVFPSTRNQLRLMWRALNYKNIRSL